jgi:two-component system OmpR family sensor kinase
VGRLFWKFFAFTWLAQLAGIVAIASTFWLTQSRFNQALTDIDYGPGAGSRVDAAAAILHYAGAAAFRDWSDGVGGPVVFAVDESGHDALDREVGPAVVAEARELHGGSRGPAPVREALALDGRRYLLFSMSRGPPGAPPYGRPWRPMRGPGQDTGPTRDANAFSGPGVGQGPGPLARARGMPQGVPIVATLLASIAGALALAWYVAKPVRSLRTAFEAVAGGNLNVRVAPSIGGRHDELADLGRDFDRMTDRLQVSMNRQRRLLHDVSHEMRSPLARLQAAAGLIRLKHGTGEPAIERIEEEIVRIDRLVGDLLKLSRLEAGELAGAAEEVDMQELVREVVEDANFEAQAMGRAVTWDPETPGMVCGRPEMLHGAIENVVRNALKHAAQSLEVRIHTAIDERSSLYVLRVLDTGPGVPEHELAGLFTPFFRAADAARTEGYGLGLAIARRSIEAHGGTIDASNRRDGGLEVTIALPLRTQGTPRSATARVS